MNKNLIGNKFDGFMLYLIFKVFYVMPLFFRKTNDAKTFINE